MEGNSIARHKILIFPVKLSAMPNVLSLVPYSFLPARTGGQKAIAQFYKYFSRYAGITCISVKKNETAAADGYRLMAVLPASPLRYVNPFLFFRIRAEIRRMEAGFFLIEHPYFGWLGWLIKMTSAVKLVVRSHNIEGNRWRSLGKWWAPLLWQYEKFTHRRADYNIFIQEEERLYAIRNFGLQPSRCLTMTFGIERNASPTEEEKIQARNILNSRFNLEKDLPLLLINGAFQYRPNRQALEDFLFRVHPLLEKRGLRYQLLVCGMDIPTSIFRVHFNNVIMPGFVEDLAIVLTGSDMLLNPVVQGGGIKTKLVEALGFGLNAVSTESGAVGVSAALCNGKLLTVPDNDWQSFADAIEKMLFVSSPTPPAFFDHFNWEKLAARAAGFIQDQIQ